MHAVVRPLGLFSLFLIQMTALGGVKSWPAFAEYGAGAFFIYLAALLFFLIPVGCIAAELSSSHPEGLNVWMRKAFGTRIELAASWLLWVQNILWIPCALLFITTTLSHIFFPNHADNPVFCTLIALPLLWILTLLNMLPVRVSALISAIGALCGIFLPAIFIIFLGLNDKTPAAIPSLPTAVSWPLLSIIVISLMGLEMPGAYGSDVKTPAKTYPKALSIALLCLTILPLLGIYTLTLSIPSEDLTRVHGSIQAFAYLLDTHHLSAYIPALALCLAIGAIAVVNTWMLGPNKILSQAAQKIPALSLIKTTKSTLLLQAVFISLVILGNLYLADALLVLPILAAELYLCLYLMLFAAFLRLHHMPPVAKSFRLPGKTLSALSLTLPAGGCALIALICSFLAQDTLIAFFAIAAVIAFTSILSVRNKHKPSPL